jgi:hypothetical protein
MTRIIVSPEALEGLAVVLGQVADDLAGGAAQGRELAWSLGAGDSAGVLAQVLGDFEHQRLLLGRGMVDLSAAVRAAGRAYVEVDESVVVGEDG